MVCKDKRADLKALQKRNDDVQSDWCCWEAGVSVVINFQGKKNKRKDHSELCRAALARSCKVFESLSRMISWKRPAELSNADSNLQDGQVHCVVCKDKREAEPAYLQGGSLFQVHEKRVDSEFQHFFFSRLIVSRLLGFVLALLACRISPSTPLQHLYPHRFPTTSSSRAASVLWHDAEVWPVVQCHGSRCTSLYKGSRRG